MTYCVSAVIFPKCQPTLNNWTFKTSAYSRTFSLFLNLHLHPFGFPKMPKPPPRKFARGLNRTFSIMWYCVFLGKGPKMTKSWIFECWTTSINSKFIRDTSHDLRLPRKTRFSVCKTPNASSLGCKQPLVARHVTLRSCGRHYGSRSFQRLFSRMRNL